MKTNYLLILFWSSFNFLTAQQNIQISGSIANPSENEITITGFNFQKSFELDQLGTFEQQFTIEHDGLYNISFGKNNATVYLTKNSNLNIDFDDANFLETLNFTGTTAAECNYLAQKQKINLPKYTNREEIYSKKEDDFILEIEKMQRFTLLALKDLESNAPLFYQLEFKNVIYDNNSYLSNYKIFYSLYTKSSVPKAKKIAERTFNYDTISMSNEEFLYNSLFRGIQYGKFTKAFMPKFEKTPAQVREILQEDFKKYNNPIIEDIFLKTLANTIKTNKGKDKNLFDAIISLSKDELFKTTLQKKMETIDSFVNGSPAPNFELKDKNGTIVKLEDFKGQNIYIDFWATWCKPCIAEIPDLKKLEAKFKGKNIVFLSISLDNQKDIEKWKKYIIDKELEGIHLIVDNDWNSKVCTDYMVEAIPRFVLIDTEGFVIEVDAPRPSSSKSSKMISRLDKL